MQTTIYERRLSGESLNIWYASPSEMAMLPQGSPWADHVLVWRFAFEPLYRIWRQLGGADYAGPYPPEFTALPGFVAIWPVEKGNSEGEPDKIIANPAQIDIIENSSTLLVRKAWGNSFADRALMIDMMLCTETQEPIFQHLFSYRFTYYQLLLPTQGRIYGIRKAVEPTSGGIAARHAIEA